MPGVVAEALGDGALALAQYAGIEFDGSRLVDPMDVSKHRGQEVEALVEGAEHLGHPDHVLGRGVELGPVDVLVVAGVLDPSHDPDLQLEHDVEGGALLQQFLGEGQVLFHGQLGGVQHVRLEQRPLPLGLPAAALLEEGADVPVHSIGRAVVGVHRHVDRVLVGHDCGELGQPLGADHHALVRLPGGEFRPPVGNLEDAVRLGEAETLQGGEDRRRGGHVDGGEGVSPAAGRSQDLPILIRGDYWHGISRLGSGGGG